MLLGQTDGFSIVRASGSSKILPVGSLQVNVVYDGNSEPFRVQIVAGFELCSAADPESPILIVRVINVRVVDDFVLSLSGLASSGGYKPRQQRRINWTRGEDGRRPPM